MSRYTNFVCFAFLFALALPLAACGDDNDEGGQAALLSTFPGEAFVGRTTSVVLFGEHASFTSSSTVDFGAGVAVKSVMAIGSNGLIVEIAADVDASTGPRPVTVDGLTLADGFKLTSPIEVKVLGTPAQGSFSVVRIKNLDLRNPFDLTTDEETGEYLNLTAVASSDAGRAVVNRASAFELDLVLQLDVDATPGPLQIDVKSGLATAPVVSRTSVDVTARSAMAIGNGAITGSVANGYDSVLYEVTAEKLTAVLAGVPNTQAGSAFLQVLGPTGSFTQPYGAAYNSLFGAVTFSNNIAQGEKIYIVLWDGNDAAGYNYSFNLGLIEASTTIDHQEPNDTSATAQAVALPGGVLNATFASADDADWYKVQLAAGDVGKKITVVTGGSSQADPVIQIFAPDGTTSVAGPRDSAYFDRLTSPAITQAGTYFVKITSSDYGPTVPNDSAYTVVIALE